MIPEFARTSAGAEPNGANAAGHLQTPSTEGSAAVLELVRLVAQLQGDVVAKAESAAMWQTRAELLAVQLQQREHELADVREELRALQPPTSAIQDGDSPKIAPQRDSDAPSAEPIQESSATPNGRPWWRFWAT